MSFRERLADRLGVQLDPETVERASRWERWRRFAWLNGTPILTAAIVIGVAELSRLVGLPRVAGPMLLAWLLLDFRLFSWGVERFDLVAPWQFREEEQEVDE